MRVERITSSRSASAVLRSVAAATAELARKGYQLSGESITTSSGATIAFLDAPEGYEVELIQAARA